MDKKSKTIGIITPGGDASGINACIRAVTREAIYAGFDVYGIYYGYRGLIEGDIKKMTARSVGNIIQQGGTILHSSRSDQIRTEKGLRKAANQLKRYGIDYLVVIGGEGSLTAGHKLSEFGIKVIGIPASIDNDVFGTDETIGFDTAMDVAVEAIDKIRDTAKSFDRIFIVEVMGRKHGFLALGIGVASGAEEILVPEVPFDFAALCKRLNSDQKKGKSSEIIVMAEGTGSALELAKRIEKATGISTRASILGYIQRGGAPSARSRILGTRAGSYAIGLIKKNISNKAVVFKGGSIRHISLVTIRRTKTIDKKLYASLVRVSS
jgi:6-phosphofructokinase 1